MEAKKKGRNERWDFLLSLENGVGSARGGVEQSREGETSSDDGNEDDPLSVVRKRAVGDLVGAVDAEVAVVRNGGVGDVGTSRSTSASLVGNLSRGRSIDGRTRSSDHKVVGEVLSRSQLLPTSLQASSAGSEVLTQPRVVVKLNIISRSANHKTKFG